MKRFFIYSLLIIFMVSATVSAKSFGKKNKEPAVKSTQGLEVTQTDAKKVSSAKSPEDKEAKQRLKNRKKIMKNIHKIEGYENNKRLKERDKEFLEHRLNLKKQKLEELGVSIETEENTQETEQENQPNEQNTDTKTDNNTENDKKGEN